MVRDVDAARALVVADRRGGRAAGRPRPPDRARAAPAGRAGGRVGRAALGRPRRAAALLAAAPPAAGRRRRAAGDDERQRLRRADRARGRRRAQARLDGIADAVLLHDRPIHTRTDDSVLRAVPTRRPLLMRRSRGFVPDALPLPGRGSPPARVRGRAQEHVLRRQGLARLGLAPHRRPQGLRRPAGLRGGRRALRAPVRGGARGGRPRRAPRLPLDAVRARTRGRRGGRGPAPPRAPRGVPRRARRDAGGRRARSTTASGFGRDGSVWGGELLVGDLRDFERAGAPVAGPPARAATARCASRGGWRWRGCSRPAGTGRCRARTGGAPSRSPSSSGPGSRRRWTTSMGRLFDAVAALCGLRDEVTYEGQAAVELEAVADRGGARRVRDARASTRGRPCWRSRPTSRAGSDPAVVSARFHNAVARATADALTAAGEEVVVLSGGVFQNRRLLTADPRRARGRRSPRARARSACRRTTAGFRTAKRRWRRSRSMMVFVPVPSRPPPHSSRTARGWGSG